MRKSELIALHEQERARTDALLVRIDPEQAAVAEVRAGWTVKDLLAHVAAWEAELVLGLAQIRRGGRPRYAALPDAEIDELNARWHMENRDRPLERVLADFHGVRGQTLRQIESFSEDDLTRARRYPWLGDVSLAAWIASDSYDHEAEHRAEIEAWLKGVEHET